MLPMQSFSALLLSGLAAAASIPGSIPGSTPISCTEFNIPIDISARLGVFPEIPAESNLEVTSFVQEFLQQGRNYTASILKEYATVGGEYSISAKYCYPDTGAGSTIQLLSHGIGFDKTYWDLPYDDYKYSYAKVANANGFSTLAIDRLGIGQSSHGDPINEIQAQLEVEALNAVTTLLRAGKIPQIKTQYNKVIHVGHSFGSVQSYWLSALYPNNTDGLVLTGWAATGSFLPFSIAGWNLHSARLNQPLRFGDAPEGSLQIYAPSTDIWQENLVTTEIDDLIISPGVGQQSLNYPSGYITHSDLTANQFVFLRYGAYDVKLGIITENTKQPVTIGELLTIIGSPLSSSFSGPVLVYTGQYDQPFCGLDCFATGGAAPSIPAQAKAVFPNAGVFEAYIQPNTGHGINVHYNSSAGNTYVQNWLTGHGF